MSLAQRVWSMDTYISNKDRKEIKIAANSEKTVLPLANQTIGYIGCLLGFSNIDSSAET